MLIRRHALHILSSLLIIAGCTTTAPVTPPPPPPPPAATAAEPPPHPAPHPVPVAIPPMPGAQAPVHASGPTGPSMDDKNYAIVKAFYATSRNKTSRSRADQRFGDLRGPLAYGVCEVSIPRDHRMGELEKPVWWRFEFRENPAKHVALLKTSIEPKDQFFKKLTSVVRSSKGKTAFLFVHGYNVTFADAARRTAQMSYDLGFDGAPVFFSWPSRGATLAYTRDEQSIEWSQAHLKTFLAEFFARSEAQNIYLIAHSMGSRALTRAVADVMKEQPQYRPRLKEIILAAPDIDADVFKDELAPAMVASGRPITLYASSGDKALVASKVVHQYRRAGDSHGGILVVPGIESVDASQVKTDLLGHSYVGDTSSVLSDIFYLINNSLRADQRNGIRRVAGPQGTYWEFKR